MLHLGCVTYNLLKDWDLETIIKKLEEAGFEAVELRTGHAHKIEPDLDAAARAQVKKRFERTKVRLLSYGSTCEFQSPDPAERRKQTDLKEVRRTRARYRCMGCQSPPEHSA